MILRTPEYLGEAVYVQVDDTGQLVISTDSHNLDDAGNIVFLDGSVVKNLLRYIKSCTPTIGDL